MEFTLDVVCNQDEAITVTHADIRGLNPNRKIFIHPNVPCEDTMTSEEMNSLCSSKLSENSFS